MKKAIATFIFFTLIFLSIFIGGSLGEKEIVNYQYADILKIEKTTKSTELKKEIKKDMKDNMISKNEYLKIVKMSYNESKLLFKEKMRDN